MANTIIQNVSTQRFSCDGIHHFKNFVSKVSANYITIYNAYDSRDELVSNKLFSQVVLNGVTYSSVALLQQALLPVIFTRDTLGVTGGGGGIQTVSGALVDNTDPLNPIVITPTKADIGLGFVDNTPDAYKPISYPVANALTYKQNVSEKSVSIPTDGTSNVKYPSVKAVKDYVDNAVSTATVPDATTISKGKLKLAGDLGGTADLPTVPALATKQPILVSGVNIKTVNGQSLLGSGDFPIGGGGGSQNLQEVTDIGNQTSNPILLNNSNFNNNGNNGVFISADVNPTATQSDEETMIGCYDSATDLYLPTRYSKRHIFIPVFDVKIILSLNITYYNGFDFQCVFHNTTIQQKIHAKGSVTFDDTTDNIRYKIEYLNAVGEEQDYFTNYNLRVEIDYSNNCINLIFNNDTGNKIYCHINANLL